MRTINTIGERIKQVRESCNLTQQEFADRLGTKRSNIGSYETDKRTPSAVAIATICREFHINEAWLRSGAGEMKSDMTLQQELALAFGDVLASAPDKRSVIVSVLLNQPPELWDHIADLAEEIAARFRAEKEGQSEDRPPDGQ